MTKTIKIKLKDNKDVLIFIDKIQYVAKNDEGCEIALNFGCTITTTSNSFETIENAIFEALKDGETE